MRAEAVGEGQLGMLMWKDAWDDSHVMFLLAGRANYHYQFLDNLDTYAGLSLGYAWGGFGFGAQLGARYYFNNKFAGNIEFGGFTGFALGVSMKL